MQRNCIRRDDCPFNACTSTLPRSLTHSSMPLSKSQRTRVPGAKVITSRDQCISKQVSSIFEDSVGQHRLSSFRMYCRNLLPTCSLKEKVKRGTQLSYYYSICRDCPLFKRNGYLESHTVTVNNVHVRNIRVLCVCPRLNRYNYCCRYYRKPCQITIQRELALCLKELSRLNRNKNRRQRPKTRFTSLACVRQVKTA